MRSTFAALSVLVLSACGGKPADAQGDGYAPSPLPAPTGDALADMKASIEALQARDENTVDEVTVQHVLISFKGSGTKATRSKADAEKLAARVYHNAIVDKVDFGDLVTVHTDDSPPGIYTMVTNQAKKTPQNYLRSGMVPAFGNVGWRLRVGEIGVAPHDAEASKYGWHIIKRVK